MFFAPTILSLLAQQCKVSVLCVSTGNFHGKGNIRRQEMFDACESMGIPKSDVTVMDLDDMQDGKANKWEVERLANIILQHVKDLKLDVIVTFDENGISYHPNHIACFNAVRYLYTNGWIPSSIQEQDEYCITSK
ncbi:unnamed protein product [Bursaphelenchus okinawaensis]|uniref:N-acetylglucosaminylphosphatidylinositol deacetylase n=1 Tax=Bursaphelenchus okinawaensis TaxID=465554 RepID=A0A811JSB1_9BILA|nr:unnamed protein product [Bursaphelenchus okinawaensis]CAG9080642.1 unnamed protein product [Bursaphelenchus okinawaensis]